MMHFAGYVTALLPVLAAWQALRRWSILAGPARLGAAYALGVGVSATGFFIARTSSVPIPAYLWLEALLSMAATIRWARQASTAPRPIHGRRRVFVASSTFAVAALIATVVGAGAVTRHQFQTHPFGTSDTWAIWNVHAVFLASEGPSWKNAFAEDTSLSHPDYPLLLPGAVARLWWLAGRGPEASGYLSVSVLAATALLVCGAVAGQLGSVGLVASLGLLLTPEFVRQGATQHADLLLGLYTVLGVILVSTAAPSPATLVAAGAACGCAAWTKNEGLVVAAILPLLTIVNSWLTKGRGRAVSAAADLAVGLWPFLLVLALFKLLLAPDNDVMAGVLSPGAWRYWMDSARVWFVAREMLRGIWAWGGWPFVPVVGAVLAVAAVPKQVPRSSPQTLARLGALLLAVQILVFFSVYVMTPHSVAWHVSTSWSRLVAQLWPTAVWCACMSQPPTPKTSLSEPSRGFPQTRCHCAGSP